MARPTPSSDRDREPGCGSGPEPLLGVRAAIVLALALAAGVVTGALTLWADGSVPVVVLAALSATSGAVRVLNEIIAR
ncbi:hypothetical protein [Actinomadura rupiterrae]|uniref:hypothetical protein n=1 Tax=Actinomadura rupiterrae TaxID=559627 RepID=UPI0020A2B0DE|nr:hypothetical protein [Actinomadura rupiterrae]MCP2340667.1 hypothetical protein [Actinomadura rupiterrae]